jgi:Rhs element Vgr protein
MALIRDTSRAQIAFQIEGGEPGDFLVLRYRGSEGVCRLFRFEIELSSSQSYAGFDAVIGKPAVLSINTANGARWFHGIVSRFEMTGHAGSRTLFRAEVVPAMWLLTHRYNSRIFQNKTVVEIIETVLTDAGLPTDRFDFSALDGNYQPREYCVQYRETDYNFCARMMEEAGIYWYFNQTEEAHILVAGDSSTYQPVVGDPMIPYAESTGLNVQGEHVHRFRIAQCVRPGSVVLNDFNYENPSLDLEVRADSGRDIGLEFSDYPGEYAEQSVGSGIAGIRAQEFEAGRTVAVGQSNSYRLAPGVTFDLGEHPAEALNRTYLVTSAIHEGKQSALDASSGSNGKTRLLDARTRQSVLAARQSDDPTIRELAGALLQIAARLGSGDPTARRELSSWLYHAGQVCRDLPTVAAALGGNPIDTLSIPNLLGDLAVMTAVDLDASDYECRFECIPGDVTYRPPRVTPWPVMRGSQTARVVGKAGEEIFTGGFDENSSCWIRVSQGIAGGQYGMMFLPRVGQEVIVDFLEGDPDHPIITGRVYNGENRPPYPLPDEKTKSTIKTNSSVGGDGFNEIRFEDKKDAEQLFIHAQKDYDLRIENDLKKWVGNDWHLKIANDRFEEVTNNSHSIVRCDQKEQVAGNANLTVDGDRAMKIGGAQGVEVGGDRAAAVSGDDSLDVGGARNIKVGQGISLDVSQNINEKAGQNIAFEAGQNIHIKGGMNVVIEGGVGLTIKVGGNFVNINPGGVFIKGNLVFINSGGSAGSGSGCTVTEPAPPSSADAPEEPLEADRAEPGEDVSSTRSSAQAEALKFASVRGAPFCEICERVRKQLEQ